MGQKCANFWILWLRPSQTYMKWPLGKIAWISAWLGNWVKIVDFFLGKSCFYQFLPVSAAIRLSLIHGAGLTQFRFFYAILDFISVMFEQKFWKFHFWFAEIISKTQFFEVISSNHVKPEMKFLILFELVKAQWL